jgi:hypothetical protein
MEQSTKKEGVPWTIKRGSVEEQIIAEKMENGCSFQKTQMWVNDYLGENGLTPVTQSAVISAYHNMVKVITPINKRAQGSSDAGSEWAQE